MRFPDPDGLTMKSVLYCTLLGIFPVAFPVGAGEIPVDPRTRSLHARVSRSLLCVASAGTGTGDGALCGLSAAPGYGRAVEVLEIVPHFAAAHLVTAGCWL
jgi:hypothetical protein